MAFVTYTDRKCMYVALSQREPRLRGEILNLQEALPKGVAGDSTKSAVTGVAEPVSMGSSRDARRLFVTNLPPETTAPELAAFFSQWGSLSDVFYTPPNNFGYVTFEREADLRTILRGGRLQIRGTDIKISEARPRENTRRQSESGSSSSFSESRREEEEEPNSRLFVKGVPEEAADADLKTYFSTFGEVIETYKMAAAKAPAPGAKPTRCMFVTYSRPQEMWKALSLDTHIFDGVQLRVSEAAPKPKNGGPVSTKVVQDCRIYVRGVPKEVTDEDIAQHFSSFGPLHQVHRPKKDNQGSQFLFVTFTNLQDMARALAHEPHTVGGTNLIVTKARARPEPARTNETWDPAPSYPPLLRTPIPPRHMIPDFAANNPFMDQPYDDYGRDPYTAALTAFAQAAVPVPAGWEGRVASYKPEVSRGKQLRDQRYSPY